VQLLDTSEQQELRQVLRRALEVQTSSTGRREVMAGERGVDDDLWRLLAGELGLAGLLVPAAFGGSGASAAEAAVVLEELGRVLACVPYLSTAVLVPLTLVLSGDEAAMSAYLPKIASGTSIAALAGAESNGRWAADDIALCATESAEGWQLTGTKSYVIDGHLSELTIAVARAPYGISLFAVEGSPAGLQRTASPTMDQTRRLARLDFDQVPARLIGRAGGGWPVVEQVLDTALAMLSAEHVGGLQQLLDLSVEYAKTRVQFGLPIGTFQGVKHRCADMLIALEMARSLAVYATWCASTHDPDLQIASAMARAYCSDAYFEAACATIQVHGGTGFTWEHDAHLYLKRAATSRLLFGAPSAHRDALATLLAL
jgi:alkylation response protein AidB-like acyl-CoA dehydrogenase